MLERSLSTWAGYDTLVYLSSNVVWFLLLAHVEVVRCTWKKKKTILRNRRLTTWLYICVIKLMFSVKSFYDMVWRIFSHLKVGYLWHKSLNVILNISYDWVHTSDHVAQLSIQSVSTRHWEGGVLQTSSATVLHMNLSLKRYEDVLFSTSGHSLEQK